jgi:hypothetical protein
VLIPSVASQVTVITPSANVEPLGGKQTTGTTPLHASVAVGVVHVTTVLVPLILAGQVIIGGIVSLMTTLKLQFVAAPLGFVAAQLTTLVPTGNTVPEIGVQNTGTRAPHELRASTANTAGVPHSRAMSAGQVIEGATASSRMIQALLLVE